MPRLVKQKRIGTFSGCGAIASILLLNLATFSFAQEIQYGRYCRENPAGDYSVRTEMTLKPDGTFEYEFIGHLTWQKETGTFRVSEGTIVTFTYDTSNLKHRDEKEMTDTAPRHMKYRNGKLYNIAGNGKPVRTARLLSKHRRFYLFGDYSRRQKVFLRISGCGRDLK